jgi:hypothetical protein
MRFREFTDYVTYQSLLDESAALIVEKGIDPQEIQELADLYLEFNPFKMGATMAGGAAGAMMGGPMGAPAGAMAGRWLSDKVGNWINKGKTPQIEPAFQQAKQAVDNLAQAIQQNNAPGNFNYTSLARRVQDIKGILDQEGQKVAGIDQQLSKDFMARPDQQGGWAKFRRGLANAGTSMSNWAQKHPTMANLASLGTATALGGAMAGVNNWWQGGNHPNAPTDPDPNHPADASNPGSEWEKVDAAMQGQPLSNGAWNSHLGNNQAFKGADGQIYHRTEDGNIYKPHSVAGAPNAQVYQKFNQDTGTWERPSMITDYMRKTWQHK